MLPISYRPSEYEHVSRRSELVIAMRSSPFRFELTSIKGRAGISVLNGAKAVLAYRRGSVERTIVSLDNMFVSLLRNFPEPLRKEDGLRLLGHSQGTFLSTSAFPVYLAMLILEKIPMDIRKIPSFREFAEKYKEIILSI